MKGRATTIILFALLAIGLLLFFIFSGDEKRYQWFANYDADSKQPYGTLFIKQMLEGYRPQGLFIYNDKKTLNEVLKDENTRHQTDYVLIGPSLYLDNQDTDALLKFISEGNDAFISTLELPTSIIYRFYSNECNVDLAYKYNLLDSATLNFFHETLRIEKGYSYAYRVGSEDVPYSWDSFKSSIFCDSTELITPLGYISANDSSLVNFIRLGYGKGNLYIHSNPLLFTNYFLTKADKVEYAAAIFSHLHGRNMIWDEYSKVPFLGSNAYDSPLYYILQQPSLKYAWWLLILCVLLYVLFAAKRTQRVIPVLDTKTNTSLEYINMISSLHFKNANHLDMAQKKMKYFMYFIRSKYSIHIQTFKEAQIAILAEKSKVSQADVARIFDVNSNIERNSYYGIASGDLADLYHAIDSFYKQCK